VKYNKVKIGVMAGLLVCAFLVPSISAGAVPASFDWRDIGGENFVTPPKNTGNCGSTWIFGPVAAVESKIMIQNNDASLQPDLSEQHIMSCGVNNTSCSGGFPGEALEFIQTTGITAESCFAYTASESTQCNTICANATYSFIDTFTMSYNLSRTNAEVKQLIYDEGPVVINFDVYSDLSSFIGSSVYQQAFGTLEGTKSVVLIGWGTEGAVDFWAAKNDWGTGWGDGGFFKVKMDDPTVDLSFVYYPGNVDYDGDGALAINDCDDTQGAAFPGNSEICDDGIDNDCDGDIDSADSDCAASSGGGGGCGTIDTGMGNAGTGKGAWQFALTAMLFLGLWRRQRRKKAQR